MRGRMILFLWIVVFTPIIHGYRHMLWHLIPGDHLNHWAMIYWRTNHMVNSARRPLKAGWDLFVEAQIAEHGLFSGGFRSLMHHCRCVAEQKIWCGDFPLSQTRSRKRWMVRAYSSSARCFWQHWWSRIALCRLLPFWNIPRDPIECSSSPSASRCSSLWATKMFKAWYPTVGHTLVKFDQCRLGQLVPKATCLSSDLAIQCWDGLSCNHPPHKLPEDMQSSDLSRYPPPMMQGLAGAISQALSDISQELSKAYGKLHTPTTQAQMMSCLSDSKWGTWITVWTGQPLCLWHTVSHLWMSTWLSNLVLEPDPSEMGVGNLLQDDWFLRYGKTRGSHPWEVRSLTSHQNSTKQSKCLSPVGRRTIRSPMSHSGTFDNVLEPHQKMALPKGNPFFLTLISRLAKASGDPDWKYPLTLQEGVPIGVDEPTLTSPGVWPTKEELRGSPDDWEDLPSPTGRHNYDSAESLLRLHQRNIHWRKSHGLGGRPFHQAGSSRQMWMQSEWTLSWAYGGHWWRRQDSYHLWW